MSSKTLSVFFFILTIINIPLYLIYFNSHLSGNPNPSLLDYFSALSLGNVGEIENSCDRINLAHDSQFHIHCPVGKLSHLSYLGMTHDENSNCKNMRISKYK